MEVSDRARELLARAGLGGLSDRAVMVLAGIVVASVAFGAWRLWPAEAGVEVDVAPGGAEGALDVASAVEATGQATEVVVHVVGAVVHPGVYTLAEGSRVGDAVSAAGGPSGNAAQDGVNLARVLTDGEQIWMLTQDEAASGPLQGAASAPTQGTNSSAAGKVDLNSATVTELDTLPGVGPSTAQKIVDDRSANGPFRTVEDLMRVSGIGQKKFDALKELVTAG